MTDKNSNEQIKSTTDKPTQTISVSEDLLTVASDYVKCVTDTQLGVCTFMFYNTHIFPKYTQQGHMINTINHEAFLEVKVPIKSAYALISYMNKLFDEIKQTPKKKMIRYGPSITPNVSELDEEFE